MSIRVIFGIQKAFLQFPNAHTLKSCYRIEEYKEALKNTPDECDTQQFVKELIDLLIDVESRYKRVFAFQDMFYEFIAKTRVSEGYFTSRKTAPEYRYINYDLETVNKEYERIDGEIAEMQIALDKFNQTLEFEVEV